ncbi:hypothetical protein BP6252_02557 [Coleophoma cylindrospora]|uniref:Xylanolytic transcriptional activator regulatory domain-containing protein n=1 Tax=Coleophoma cylindrospora TaxID=1849047 RepID=A0A3D8SF47_9HELO|nr:hypothetical protein BP6252_02557 [Coleophoma cylindrospora]
MLTWPAIQQLILQALPTNIEDLKSLEQEGSAFIVRMQKGIPNLPMQVGLQSVPFVGMQTQASRAAGEARTTFPTLTREKMLHLATAYFDSFNLLYPFMDRQSFISEILTRVSTEGFHGDPDSVIALLVFALGEMALESSQGNPLDPHQGRSSGIVSRPPGLEYFNAARERIGFVLTECDLESVQIFSMAALYYESCSRHVDFWRLTVSASSACQVLVTCYPIDWKSPRGDLIKRAYWHCVIMETGLHLELDLPLTGIIDLEDRVGIPIFNTPFCEADHLANQVSHFEAHYASQVALRRLCANVHENINGSMTDTSTPDSSLAGGGPTAHSLKQLAAQLAQWRSMLPRELQWDEDDPTSFPDPPQSPFNLDPKLPQQSVGGKPMFSEDLDSNQPTNQYLYDVQVALLRTRYYYAKYMVYRPFIYKALHFPEQMTQLDAEGVAECLRVVVPQMAIDLLASVSKKKTHTISLLLVTELSRYPPNIPSNTAQPYATRHPNPTMRPQIRA